MEETIFSIEEHHWHVILNPNLYLKNLSYFGSIKQKLNELKLTYTAHVAESCNSGIETVKNFVYKVQDTLSLSVAMGLSTR